MRASSLSHAKVIDLLNHSFIPVHADGVFYEHNPGVPKEEKAAYDRVFRAFHQLNQKRQQAGNPILSVGSVHAYVLSAEGEPVDSLHVAEAKPDRVIQMLEKAVRTLKVSAGEPVIKPVPQAVPPQAEPDSLLLHLTARYLVPRNQPGARQEVDDEFVPGAPKLGTERSGQWDAVPSEDWLSLTTAQWKKLLPRDKVEVGSSWDMDQEVVTELLTRFYPTTENNDLSTNRIDQQSLKATVVSVKEGVVRARLDGSLKMKHAFYPRRDDQNFVAATIVGYVDFQLDKPRIHALRLVTEKATYGGETRRFGVAVRSVIPSSD